MKLFTIMAILLAHPITALAAAPAHCYEWMARTTSPARYYPQAALAEHLSGTAVLKCRRTEHDVMVGCRVTSERPSGEGFGAAALALAANSKASPTAALPLSEQGEREVTFRFTPDGPCIRPNVVDVPWMPVAPRYARYPNVMELSRAKSIAGTDTAEGGAVVLSCDVVGGGSLSACNVLHESPERDGFGKAALYLTQYMRLWPATRDGVPLVGEKLTLWVPFDAPHPLGRQ